MEISPTLGISNQYNPGPMEQYAQLASSGLQQLGAQVQQDITTIQTNQQLRSFQNDLQGINPTDVNSPNFGAQMTKAVLNNPLAAHSPVGMQAINQLGAAHTAAIAANQWKTLPGTGTLFQPGTGQTDDTGAQPLRPPVQKPVYNSANRPFIGTAGPNGFTPADLSDVPPPPAAPKKPLVVNGQVLDPDDPSHVIYDARNKSAKLMTTKNGDIVNMTDPDNPEVAYHAPEKLIPTPSSVINANEATEKEYPKAMANLSEKKALDGQNSTAQTKADVVGAQSYLDNVTENLNRTRKARAQYEKSTAPTADPVGGLGAGAAPTQAAPVAAPSPLSQADKQTVIGRAKAKLATSPSQRAAIIERLRSAGISDDDMLNSNL